TAVASGRSGRPRTARWARLGADLRARPPLYRAGRDARLRRLRRSRAGTPQSAQLPAVSTAGARHRPRPRSKGSGRLLRLHGRRVPTGADEAGDWPDGGASARASRGAGVPAQRLLPLPLPAAIAESGRAASSAPRRVAGSAAAFGRGVHARRGPVSDAIAAG